MSAVEIAQLGCGTLFLVGMLTGFWKYRSMITSEAGEAPVYVDICHRTALMYAFASLVLAEFARLSTWPDWVNAIGVAVPLFFFCTSVAIYAVHGFLNDTDNQLRRPHRLGLRNVHGRAISFYMYLLTVGEVGGFLVLFSGFLRSLV
jgi:hypothetical protein